jgi:hypothetical protein
MPAVQDITADWRNQAVQQVWLYPRDWAVDQVNDLVETYVAGGQLEPALKRLGRARGQAGVGIDETLADAALFAEVVGLDLPPWAAAQAVASGWADGSAAAQPAVDPASDLPTLAYLTVRLRELYQEVGANGQDMATTKALVVVDTEVECVSRELVAARAAGLGSVITNLFTDGRPMACLNRPAAVGVVVLDRDDTLPVWLARLRLRLSAEFAGLAGRGAVRQPPRVWVEQLPRTYLAALDLLTSLIR